MKPRPPRRVRRGFPLNLILLICLASLLTALMISGGRARAKETNLAANKESAGYVNANGGVAPAPSGLITVTSTAGTVANDGQCTLREAIINANDDAATWSDCEAGSGTDTIILAAAATYTLTEVDNGSNGLPQITSEIIIQGNDSTIQRSGGAPRFRIFEVAAAGNLTLNHVIISGGHTADGANSVGGADGAPGVDGGGIYNSGALTLVNCTVSGNQTGRGGFGVDGQFGTGGGDGGKGGGVYNNGTLTLTDSTIRNNRAGDGGFSGSSSYGLGGFGRAGGKGGPGGGIYHSGGTLTLTNSIVSDNNAGNGNLGGAACNGCVGGPGGEGGNGGGIHIRGGTVTLTTSQINNNRAGASGNGGSGGTAGSSGVGGYGGGIYHHAGTLNVTNCTLDNNRAGDAGVSSIGFFVVPGGLGGAGGGIYNRATLDITGSTLSNNTAGKGGTGSIGLGGPGNGGRGGKGGSGGSGGGIGNENSGALNLTNSTLSNNTAGLGGTGGDCISGNPCAGGEGGVGGFGGGIHNAGTVNLTNATISHNSTGAGGVFGTPNNTGVVSGPPGRGGGIFSGSGSIKLRNTIIAKNTLQVGETPDVAGPFTSLGHNFIGQYNSTVSSGFTDDPGCSGLCDKVGTLALAKDPLLGPLAANGGPTKTRNLEAGSTAIDAGDNCVLTQSCASDNLRFDLTTDQRGLLRPQLNSVDIGSVEAVDGVPGAPDLLPVSDSGSSQTDDLTNATNLQFEVTGAGAGATVELLRNGTFVATATADSNGTATLSYTDNSADGTYNFTSRLNVSGSFGAESAPLPVTIDRSRRSVTINQAGGQADPTSSLPINFTVVFNEAVSDFDNTDVSLTGSTANVSAATINVTGSGTTYNVAIGNVTADGTVQASVLENATVDAAGNSSTASTSTDNTVTRDTTPPTVTTNQAAGQSDPTSSLPINFTVVFNEAVTGFTETDVLLTGSTANISAATINVTGGGTTYNVAVGNIIGSGTVQVSIPAGAASDAAGVASASSTSTDNTVTYNLPPPSVTINQAAGQLDPTASLPINFTVVFNQPVTGFTNTDVSLAGSTANVSAATINVTGGGTTYNVAVSNVTSDGTVQASIPANVAANVENGLNTASTSTDNIVTRDTTPTILTVNTLGDAGDNVCDATCTLRDAAITAASTPGLKHIRFNLPSCTAASPCTITLTRGELTINSTSPVSIFGPGANMLTVSGNNQSRVFVVNNAGLDLSDLKLTGGRASDGSPGGDGGAIYNNNGTLTLTNIILSGNNAGNGVKGIDIASAGTAGIGGKGGNGGAIYNKGTLTLINSTVSGNSAGAGGEGGWHYCCPFGLSGPGGDGGSGGGIYSTGTLTLINSTISNNNAGLGGTGGFTFDYNSNGAPGGAGGHGGGIYTTGPMNISGSTFNNNNAGIGGSGGENFGRGGVGGQGGHGGAVYNNGALVLTNATLSSNNAGQGGTGGTSGAGSQAQGGAGGGGGMGGAIYNNTGTLNLVNITVTNNSAAGGGSGGSGPRGGGAGGSAGNGGGLAKASGTVSVRNSIIARNNLAFNVSGPDLSGAFTSLGHNFIGKNDNSTGFTNGNNGDQVGTIASPKDPLLGPLQDNGGLTQTILPAQNSTVIDAGDNCITQASHCGDTNLTQLTTDQRGTGFPRIVNANGTATVDIGAVEFSVTQQAQINFSNLIQTYDGTPKTVTVTTVPSGLNVVITYDGASTPPTNVKLDGGGNVVSYSVVATINGSTYQGSANATLTITKALSTTTVTANNATYDGSPHGATAIVTGAGGLNQTLSVSYTGRNSTVYPQSTSAPVGAGDYTASANFNGDANHEASNDGKDFTIAKAAQTITFNALPDKTSGDAPFILSATASSGLPVSFSIVSGPASLNGDTVTITGAGTVKVRASQAGNGNYNAASDVDRSFTVAKASQTISFGALSSKTFGDAPFTISATGGGSGNPVTFVSQTPAVCSVSASTVTILAVGSCTVRASQAGNNDYQAAADVDQSFDIGKASQSITFGALTNKSFGDADFSVSATATSNLAVSFSASGQCAITGNTVHLTGAGPCTITASQAGNSNYEAAADVQQGFQIDKSNQTIAFDALPIRTFGDADFQLSATATSGLAISFAASGQCSVTGGTVHLTGAGSCTITASQAGSSNFNAAADVPQSFQINKSNQTITFNALSSKSFGDADFSVSATASSGLAVSFSATGNCTVNGITVHLTGAGSCTVTASQGGDDNFSAAQDVIRSFNINKADQTINFGALSDKTFGDAPFTVNATASSGLAVSFSIQSGPATINGSTVTITGAGTVTVRASQGGDSNYQPASNVDRSFTVNKANQAITFNTLSNRTFGDAPFAVSATGGASGNPVTFSVSGNCTSSGMNGSTITITGAGSCTVTASQAGNTNYNAAPDVSQSFTVAKANQTITFGALSNKTYGDGPITLSATASSGLPISFTTTGGCTVSGNTLTFTGTGNCTVTASQSGNNNYNSAPSVSRSFTIIGALGIEVEVLNGLKTLRPSITDKQDGKKLDEAISSLTAAVDSTLWLDQLHLVAKNGEKVFDRTEDAINKLQDLLRDRKSTVPNVALQSFVIRLLQAGRLLAQVAINEAAAAPRADARKIAEAIKELSRGDSDVTAGRYGSAIGHYREAWKYALTAMGKL